MRVVLDVLTTMILLMDTAWAEKLRQMTLLTILRIVVVALVSGFTSVVPPLVTRLRTPLSV